MVKPARKIPGIVSFDTGDAERTRRMASAFKVFSLAESLGGVESLVAHPASMTHASMTPQARANAGISDGLIRLSIGVEDLADLLADLEQALAK